MTRTDLSRAAWRKSSRSGLNGGTVLFFTRPEMTAWIKGVKHHEFNNLT